MIINHLHNLKYIFNNSLIMTLFVDIQTKFLSYESHNFYNGNLYASMAKDVKA